MGRYLKNAQLTSRSHAIQIPIGSSSVGPDAPVNGQIRFNQTNSEVEFFYGSKWYQIAHIGSVQLVVDTFVGDGSTTTFTMSQVESDPTAILVSIGGVYQTPTSHYTVNGTTTITFSSPPPAPGINPNQIVIVHNINSTNAA
jgi:hypothetical protein